MKDAEKKKALQEWLEESYDATEQIEDMISQERAEPGKEGEGQMGEVYLDLDADVQLTRMELLEVSWNCYAGVLKKLATIFTHLKVRAYTHFSDYPHSK